MILIGSKILSIFNLPFFGLIAQVMVAKCHFAKEKMREISIDRRDLLKGFINYKTGYGI
jgi:hypothetical protein